MTSLPIVNVGERSTPLCASPRRALETVPGVVRVRPLLQREAWRRSRRNKRLADDGPSGRKIVTFKIGEEGGVGFIPCRTLRSFRQGRIRLREQFPLFRRGGGTRATGSIDRSVRALLCR